MFNRRIPEPLPSKITKLMWPRIGWRRTLTYYWQRLRRIPGTPESIAAGFACGAAASMMPLIGFHFLLSALLALLLRGSVLASMIGTVVGNPWTFPLIWLGTYELGSWFLGGDHADGQGLAFLTMFGDLVDAALAADGALFAANVWPLWWPMLVGSLPVAVLTWWISYRLLLTSLNQIKRVRSRRESKQH